MDQYPKRKYLGASGGKDNDGLSLNKLPCKSATRFFVKNKFVMPTAEKSMIKANLNEKTIQLIYSLPFKVTKDTRLAIFQFKIIHHILPTNATLFRDALKETDKCHLCSKDKHYPTLSQPV